MIAKILINDNPVLNDKMHIFTNFETICTNF